MKEHYIIEYYQKGIKNWTRHTFIDYLTLEEAKKEVTSYREHDLGIKFRILLVKEVAN